MIGPARLILRFRGNSMRRKIGLSLALVALPLAVGNAQEVHAYLDQPLERHSRLLAELQRSVCLPAVARGVVVSPKVSADQVCRIAGYAFRALNGIPLPLCSDHSAPLRSSGVDSIRVGRTAAVRFDGSLIGLRWMVEFSARETRNVYLITIDEESGLVGLSAVRENRVPNVDPCAS